MCMDDLYVKEKFSVYVGRLPLSPTETNEGPMHEAAQRAGLTFPCKITYLELPLCVGHDDHGSPVLEVKQWPFLLPSDMDT